MTKKMDKHQTNDQRSGLAPRGDVLIVEDNLANQKVMECMLVRLGFNVAFAENGLQALESVRGKRFDLIFMDCQMPVMDGYVATQKLKAMMKSGEVFNTPIIAVTANALMSDRRKCIDAGMDDFMAKPVRLKQLDEIASVWLGVQARAD